MRACIRWPIPRRSYAASWVSSHLRCPEVQPRYLSTSVRTEFSDWQNKGEPRISILVRPDKSLLRLNQLDMSWPVE